MKDARKERAIPPPERPDNSDVLDETKEAHCPTGNSTICRESVAQQPQFTVIRLIELVDVDMQFDQAAETRFF